MSKDFWFVIEGDNGAGKDTLADRLIGEGWLLTTRIREVVAKKEQASRLSGLDRINAFMTYNKICGELILASPAPSFLVRYWPSTVAAAFADAIFEWEEIDILIANILHELPAPNLILYLECGLDTRRNRVHERGLIPGSIDDLSQERDKRYREAIGRLANYQGVGNWRNLDTSKLSIEQVYMAIQSLLPKKQVLS